MLEKKEQTLIFNNKRNYKLITPCCDKSNKDGKFINYRDLPDYYGYCHSCGIASLPPTIYVNEEGEEFIWDKSLNKYATNNILNSVANMVANSVATSSIPQKFITEDEIWQCYHTLPENNLLQYLRRNYDNKKVEDAKEVYLLSTSENGGSMFWNVNKMLQIQKLKIAYYDENGRRKNQFKVPYKNEDGYHPCLFGEHILSYDCHQNSTVILVESEKTAIIGYILLPQYVWLAYGGCNGLTNDKIQVLKGFSVLLVPDISGNAIMVATKKIIEMRQNGIDVKLWDMTEGKTDEELKNEAIYNKDLEDFFREIS